MLTVKEINSLEILPKPYKVSDGRGLYLYVHPNGSKYWRYDYQFDSKRKTLSYGVFPKVSLALARQKHMEAQSRDSYGCITVDSYAEYKLIHKALLAQATQRIPNTNIITYGTITVYAKNTPACP